MATRCFSPPESWSGRKCIRSVEPEAGQELGLRSRPDRRPGEIAGEFDVLAAVERGERLKSWNTNPNCERAQRRQLRSGGVATSTPSTVIVPRGRSIAPSINSSVVLPQPDGPMMSTTSPAATSRSTCARQDGEVAFAVGLRQVKHG